MKKVHFAPKPSAGAGARTPDQWVGNQPGGSAGGKGMGGEPTKRLTIDVTLSLHRRMKAQCAVEELVMADVMRELLEKRFPESKP